MSAQDRQVVTIVQDEVDPSFAKVEFNDGTSETMPTSQAEALPTSQAEALPQEPAPLLPGEIAAMNPPPAPEGDPVAMPNPLAQQWEAAGQDLIVQANEANVAAPGFQAPAGRPTNPLPDTPGGVSELPAPQVDMGEIVGPGAPGRFAPFSESATEGAQTTERVEDPNVALGRVDDAYNADAQAKFDRDTAAYETKTTALQNESVTRDNQALALERQIKQAEAEKAFHEKVFQAIEKTPIDEDAFWSESPGRAAGAWIALALSGFLQGATKGQNPALNQMVQALNHAQDRYLQNQQKNRAGQLATRERMIGDRATALASMKLQLSGIMEKRIMLDAQREGMPPPPALTTYLADGQVKRAEAKTAIGQQAIRVATESVNRELRATPATGPVTRFDAERKALGIPDEKHQKAMDSGLGDQVAGSVKVAAIRDAVKKIAAAHNGDLPAQGTMSWSQLGLAPFAARHLGVKNAEEQVSTQQLLTQATLAYMESLKSLKGIDANQERQKFEQSINTGVAASTLAALDQAADRADKAALANASGYAGGNARRYVDLLKAQQNEPKRGGFAEKDTGFRVAPTEEETIRQQAPAAPAAPAAPQTSQGGSATRPLAQSQRELQRAIQSSEDLQGYNADALARIIGFESGGRPDARNPSGATGLIQFMPKVFDGMKKPPGYEGVRHADLADLTVEEQLPLVAAYFRQAGVPADADVGEYYLAVAAPAALGKPDETVVYRRGSKAWEQNPAWRPAGGGDITAGDIRAKGRRL